MRFSFIFAFALFLVCFSYGQESVLINFEQIPDETPSEGLILAGQFLDEFSISFSIEGGGNPVLAEIGSPATAFESTFGDDTPAPNQGIGDFFLTDDGNLSGLESPPLIISANAPLQFIGGVILDIDFGEVFTLEAFDGDGNLLQTIVLDANNPDAGDGIATPWRFEVNTCAGIRSVRINGEREQEGVFGLGVDNIELQYLETAPADQIAATSVNATCGQEDGTIQLVNNGPQRVQYSLDGIDFLTVDRFPNLAEGSYTIYVRSESGCLDSLTASVDETTVIDDCGVCLEPDDPAFNQSCADCAGTPNGTAILDSCGVCLQPDDANFNQSCLDCNGVVNGPAQIDSCGVCLEPSDPIFNQSCADCAGTPNGTAIIDSCGVCIEPTDINFNQSCADCEGVPNGTFEIDACGDCLDPAAPSFNQACIDCAGTPNGSAVIDLCGECLTPDDPLFNQTCASENELYIPNAFSPNDDGRNDLFQIFPNEATSATIDRLMIFSRWGELVYEQYDIDASATNVWWDGTYQGEALPPDVFTYFVEVTFANGEVKQFEGDVTLVR
jgi:gliding motility-associated-like protein